MEMPLPVAVAALSVRDVTIDQIVAACQQIEREQDQHGWTLRLLIYFRGRTEITVPLLVNEGCRLAAIICDEEGRPLLATPGQALSEVMVCDVEGVFELPRLGLFERTKRCYEVRVNVERLANRLSDLLRT